MKLDKYQRLVLRNQFAILAEFEGDGLPYHNYVKILENGYEGEYSKITEYIHDELPTEECELVWEILSMFMAIMDAVDDGVLGGDALHVRLEFRGFDGNNEPEYLGFLSFIFDDLNVFATVKDRCKRIGAGYNSHMPTLELYKTLLHRWKMCKNKHALSRDDLNHIAGE